MKTECFVLAVAAALAAAPAFGQKIYKCPGQDGKAIYQQKECAEGARMSVRDNGRSSGATSEPEPLQGRNAPAASDGLRESEREMLRDAKQREIDAMERQVQRERIQAIKEHQQSVDRMTDQMHEDNMMRLQMLKESLKRR